LSNCESTSKGATPSTFCSLQSIMEDDVVLTVSVSDMPAKSSEKPEPRRLSTSKGVEDGGLDLDSRLPCVLRVLGLLFPYNDPALLNDLRVL